MNSYDEQFAAWWAREFPAQACPPTPQSEQELTLTAHATLRSTNPALFTNLFGGKNGVRLPADVQVRLNSAQLQPGDAAALRAAGLEVQALQCEQMGQRQADQRMADEMARSREIYQQEMAKAAAWSEMSLLERLGHAPLSPEQVAANRRRYGISDS